MNTINLIGRLTEDPELRYTKAKEPMAYCRFSLAVRRNKDVTDFIPCVAFAGTAEMVEKYFKKGYLLGLQGSLQVDKYEDEKTKEKRTTYTVNARQVFFCDSGKVNEPLPEEEPEDDPRSYGRSKGRR